MARKSKKAFLKEKLGDVMEKGDTKEHEKAESKSEEKGEDKSPFAKFKKLGKK